MSKVPPFGEVGDATDLLFQDHEIGLHDEFAEGCPECIHNAERETVSFLHEARVVTRDPGSLGPACPECGRVFDMLDETDVAEWSAGHDCEVD